MRRTKIIATLGPASNDDETVDHLIKAGVDVFRINFSHGTRDSQEAMYARVRAGARRVGRPVAIMQDLAGPKIRTGVLKDGRPVTLEAGRPFRIATGEFAGDADRVSTSFADLATAVRPGDRLLLDDGRLELRVVSGDGTEIVTEVIHGGLLGERKGITAPNARFGRRGLTEADVDALERGLTLGVDLVAVSFVETAEDLHQARRVVDAADARVWLVAKIERPQAVEEIDAILQASDAVMVARGDLGLEIPLEQVPRVQKRLTRAARLAGVPVIVATQVFDTMRHEPRPTRAEVSDAANAVDEGVDAIMLSGETATGRFPTESVELLATVIRDAETIPPPPMRPDGAAGAGHGRAMCEAAVTLAAVAEASAIVAVTRAGSTARQLAALRPTAPIYAVTDCDETLRQLMLCWGVTPIRLETAALTLANLPQALAAQGVLPSGALAAFVRIHHALTEGDANFISLRQTP